MKTNLTDTLCTRCGLCCNGTLFADVELAGRQEAAAMEVMGLEIEDEEGGWLLMQPCRALQGKRCSIYPHRPECCRTFECRLLQEVGRGGVEVERAKEMIADALQKIERVKKLISQLGQRDERLPLKERCAEALALAQTTKAGSSTKRKRAELEAAMATLEVLIQKTFLANGATPITLPRARWAGKLDKRQTTAGCSPPNR